MESFDRQIGRAGAFENVLHLGRDTGEAFDEAAAV
jgi:hypothetical protein